MRVVRNAILAVTVLVAATVAIPVNPAGATSPTVVSVRRPVTSAGHVAGGFSLHDVAGLGLIDCSHDSVSPVAVNAGIFSCIPDAAYAVACWHAAFAHHVFCYLDPFSHTVHRYAADAPRRPVYPRDQHAPFGLVLDDGNRCTIRDGGVWTVPTEHPSWMGYYSCTGSDSAVWGPPSRSYHAGIDETAATWTVYTGPFNGKLTTHAITRAWFVGTEKV